MCCWGVCNKGGAKVWTQNCKLTYEAIFKRAKVTCDKRLVVVGPPLRTMHIRLYIYDYIYMM